MSKKRNALKHIDDGDLELWRMDVKSKDKKNFQESALHGQVPLDNIEEVGLHFNGYPPKDCIHIIITVPGK